MVLHTLSPLDGRYFEAARPLRDYFSEHAYLRDRVRIEIEFLSALSGTGLVRALSEPERVFLGAFTEQDARRVQEHEQTTRHDVKAIEYFLRERLPVDLHPWIHFGITSEDINNLAQARALRDSRDRVLLPALDELLRSLLGFCKRYRALPMLARTHGQPAVPTTLGKEIAVYLARLGKCRSEFAGHAFEGKLTGAVGNLSALGAAAPQVDWLAFSHAFVGSLGLAPNMVTTQILPYDNWIRYFQVIQLVNSILIDYTQDIWRYVSDGYLKQAAVDAEVGSSTMPQKVNPIDFENAEGNLGIANALFAFYVQKLPVSRLQRDLSDSTVRRTFGMAFGHSLLAWQNVTRGMERLAPDEQKLHADLQAHWEVVSEAAQTILRLVGRSDAYESLKSVTRGQVITESAYRAWMASLDVEEETRARLQNLSPETYTGLAVSITDQIIDSSDFAQPTFKRSQQDKI
jgi:adenylosuccinate lyase